jgi:hypothetical protein
MLVASFVTLIGAATSPAQADTLVKLDRYEMDELLSRGFELPRKVRIEIEAIGARPRWTEDDAAYAWILDTTTREVVWTQERQRTERVDGDRVLRRCKSEIELGPGRYELYAWAGLDWNNNWRVRFADWNGWSRGHSDNDRGGDRELRRAVRDCRVELRSSDISANEVQAFEPTGAIPGALHQMTRLTDEQFLHVGLVVDRPMDLRLYSVCEYPRGSDSPADGGWIVNESTRERVWSMRRRDTHQGGGSEKNRVFDDTVHFEAGRYVLYYGSDGSHSYEEWNAAPPDDPMNWGVSILPGKDADPAAVHVNPNWSRGEPILKLTEARDEDILEKPFRLANDTNLQVYALGEWDEGNDEFADRAYITKASSDEVVWEMSERNTEFAGGAEKNRQFDGTVKLQAGEYVAHYETDDSHSYRDWNADAPFDSEAWGLSLYAGSTLGNNAFTLLKSMPDEPAGEALVRLVQIGDNAREKANLKLSKPTTVHIYALGEGVEGRMFDYAWIEEEKSGDIAWEMTFRSTRPAGGARKNRKFDADVRLDPGNYVVYYESDGSHSYPDWNDRRPPDGRRWGITITDKK